MLDNLDNDRIALIRAFAESALRLNFTEAANKLNLTPSTLGRRIKRLEQSLGVDLFVRTTRRVALTEAGNIYLNYCQSILSQIEEADAVAGSLGRSPAGLLRVSAPASFGKLYIAPVLPDFLNQYPDIQLDIDFTDHFVDLIEQRIDVAIRIGALVDSTMKAKQLSTNVRRLVASPSYLKKAPPLETIEDLESHKLLYFSYLRGNDIWSLEQNGDLQVVAVKPYLRSNDALTLFESALAGQGIALLADFITKVSLDKGELVTVLHKWKIPNTGIYAIYSSSSFLPAKSRVFIDFLSRLLKKNAFY
ncbi:MAG: LysR family transcriptional regulator [Methyloligellaceae bacterium]